MSKCSFKSCSTCYLPCNKAKGKKPKNITAIEYEKVKEDFKREGCPFDRK